MAGIHIPKSRIFLLGTFYRPPNSSNYYDKDFVLKLDNILDGAVSLGQQVIVLGDLNADFSAKRASIHECKLLKAFFKTWQFKQLIKEPTRIASNASTLIDLIATNNPQNIRDSGVISASLRDHEMIYCVRKLNWKKAQAQMKTFRNYANYDPVNFCEDLEGVDLSPTREASVPWRPWER